MNSTIFVGGAEAHVHYSISSRADLMIKGGLNADGTVPVTEIWRNFNTDPNNPSVPSIEGLVANMGKAGAREAFENGTLTRTFITNMEAAHLSKIATDIETYLMWGKGGRIKQDGPDDIRLSVGLWAQLDNSFKRVYNKSSFTLDMFKSELYNFYQGKVEFKGPDPQRSLVVQTGIAGMQLINKAIADEVYGSGLVQNASDIGAVKGFRYGFRLWFCLHKLYYSFLS